MDFSDTLKFQRPEILSIEIIPCTQNVPGNAVPVSHVPAVPITKNVPINVSTSVKSQSENVIKLPIDSIGDHAINEDLLDEDIFETALVSFYGI